MTNTKKSLSLRINHAEFERARKLADRLGVRQSDVFRFALKVGFAKLAPLDDARVRGRDLIPVFLECGRELADYFHLDAERLTQVINGDLVEASQRVDQEDVEMLAMSAMQERYLRARLRQLTRRDDTDSGLDEMLRSYLDTKYLEPVEPGDG